MKRGRRSIKEEAISLILEILSGTKTPLTTSSIQKLIFKQSGKKMSWNTVQKYLDELVKSNEVCSFALPHSRRKDKHGLTVYMLKR